MLVILPQFDLHMYLHAQEKLTFTAAIVDTHKKHRMSWPATGE